MRALQPAAADRLQHHFRMTVSLGAPCFQDSIVSTDWLLKRCQEHLQDFNTSTEDLKSLLVSLKTKKGVLLTGAGVEPQLFLPDGLVDMQSAAAWLKAASNWDAFVERLGTEFAARYGLSAEYHTMLCQQAAGTADIIANQLVQAAGIQGGPSSIYLAHLAGLILGRWQVFNSYSLLPHGVLMCSLHVHESTFELALASEGNLFACLAEVCILTVGFLRTEVVLVCRETHMQLSRKRSA